jgi:hypothetical protein
VTYSLDACALIVIFKGVYSGSSKKRYASRLSLDEMHREGQAESRN